MSPLRQFSKKNKKKMKSISWRNLADVPLELVKRIEAKDFSLDRLWVLFYPVS